MKEKLEKDKSEEFSRMKREYEEKYASEIQMKQLELQKKEQVCFCFCFICFQVYFLKINFLRFWK